MVYCTLLCKLNSVSMLQAHAPVIFLVIIFILIHFRPFPTIHTKKICMCFRFDPLSRVFQERFQIDTFSMKTLSVSLWTEGLSAAKCMRSQTTRTIADRARK